LLLSADQLLKHKITLVHIQMFQETVHGRNKTSSKMKPLAEAVKAGKLAK